jgi:hypothetical protein
MLFGTGGNRDEIRIVPALRSGVMPVEFRVRLPVSGLFADMLNIALRRRLIESGALGPRHHTHACISRS